MQRKRGGLVPIGEVVPGLDDVAVPAIRDDSPQARRGFTVADQVNQLVAASEADPDVGFMARTMALCSLPRSNPRDRLRYVRRNGPYTLVMNAGGLYRLPFGYLPRLLMAWINLAALRTITGKLAEGSRSARAKLAEQMTVSQVAESQRLARKWQPKTWEQSKGE